MWILYTILILIITVSAIVVAAGSKKHENYYLTISDTYSKEANEQNGRLSADMSNPDRTSYPISPPDAFSADALPAQRCPKCFSIIQTIIQ
jgi:uncharacterized protein YxeA